MRFCFRSLKSGGTIVGGVISATGIAQWVFQTITGQPFEIRFQWYELVIIGLVIILASSLGKAYSLHKSELDKFRVSTEEERHILVDKLRQISRLPVKGTDNPLLLSFNIRVDNRSLGDIYPELPRDRNAIISKVCSMSAGIVCIRNNGLEPVDVEIEYQIIDGNVPIFMKRRVDNIPLISQHRISRSDTINPKGSKEVGFVAYALVDRFHKGFKFPSYLSSMDNKLGFRKEGRTSTFRIGKIVESPYIDIKLKVIATSPINISKVAENVFNYRITANPLTSELTLSPIELGKELEHG